MDLNNKNVLMTGGTGFIGSHLIPLLLKDGAHITVLTRNPGQPGTLEHVDYVQWDARTPQGWGDLIETTDVVINLAGENLATYPWSNERIRRIRESRKNAGSALVAAIRASKHKPLVLLQASGINYYGVEGEDVKTESSPPGDGLLPGICIDWEASTQPVEDMGVRRVITRTALVLDPDEGVLPLMALPFKLFIGGPLGNGHQWVPWIHVADETSAMRFLITDEQASGAYNLVAPQAVRNNQFGRALAHALHRPYWIPAPSFVLRPVLGRMSVLVLGGIQAMPECLEQAGYQFEFPGVQAALHDIYHND